jgi:hypothetical protein
MNRAVTFSPRSSSLPSPQAILIHCNASAIAGGDDFGGFIRIQDQTERVKLWKLSWALLGLGCGGVNLACGLKT